MTNFSIQHVKYMPETLQEGILYISIEFGAAAHLCACGCGSKIRTPLGPTEWRLKETRQGPTLWPSIGNWQLPCKSHYFIDRGKVIWAGKWTEEEIEKGRRWEQKKREAYYDSLYMEPKSIIYRMKKWMRSCFGL